MVSKIFLVCVILGLTVIVLFSGCLAFENKNNVKIGIIAPLTGAAAQFGEYMLQGINIAKQELTNKNIEFVFEDSLSTAEGAVSAYNKLKAQGIKYIVGPLTQSETVPVSKLANEDKIIILSTGLPSKTVMDSGEYIFTVLPSINSVAYKILDYACNDLNYKNVSALYTDDAYGKENGIAFEEEAKRINCNLVSNDMFPKSSGDLSTQLTKIKNDSSNAIIMAGFALDYTTLLKQTKELNITNQLFATSNIQLPEVAQINKETGQKIYYSYPVFSDEKTTNDFIDKYKQYKNSNDNIVVLPMYIGAGYDAIIVLKNAISKCESSDYGCVKENLANTKDYKGANGILTFDANGNNTNIFQMDIRVLENGEFKVSN